MGEINEYKTADNVIVSLFSAGKIFSHQKKKKKMMKIFNLQLYPLCLPISNTRSEFQCGDIKKDAECVYKQIHTFP